MPKRYSVQEINWLLIYQILKEPKRSSPDENLHIKGHRWYVTANIHNLKDTSSAQAFYRVWHAQEEWKAAQVRMTLRTGLFMLKFSFIFRSYVQNEYV